MVNDLKIFYREQPDKAALIGKLLEEMSACMEKNMTLEKDDKDELDPTVQLWLYFFLS